MGFTPAPPTRGEAAHISCESQWESCAQLSQKRARSSVAFACYSFKFLPPDLQCLVLEFLLYVVIDIDADTDIPMSYSFSW